MKRIGAVVVGLAAGGLFGVLLFRGAGSTAAPTSAPAPAAADVEAPPCDLACGRCDTGAVDRSCCPKGASAARREPPAAPLVFLDESEAPADFDLRTLDGRDLRLRDLRGRVVVVNFWATFCPPCRAEIPAFVRLHEDFGESGVTIVGIALDRRPNPAGARRLVEEFLAAYGVTYPNGMAPARFLAMEGDFSIPQTFILDREGRVRRTHLGGPLPYDFLVEEVRPFL